MDGDLFVFLDGADNFLQFPSFRLHADWLATKGFGFLANTAVKHFYEPGQFLPSSKTKNQDKVVIKHLYPLVPGELDKSVLERNLTTRNFFAWLYDRPMAGKSLSAALDGVMKRITALRPSEIPLNRRDMLAYLRRQGYADFRECADHAVAVLYMAEQYEIGELWNDAFAHCVGMIERLGACVDFEVYSGTTTSTPLVCSNLLSGHQPDDQRNDSSSACRNERSLGPGA